MANETPLPVTGVIVAANLGDTEAFLQGFTLDGVVDDNGREFKGPRAIRTWTNAQFIGVGVSLDPEEVVTDGDEIVVMMSVGGGGYSGPAKFGFMIADEKVSRMTIRN